ncbi:MAG: M4 family metallopeptidase, partial [Bacteroidota bacterium]
SGLLAQTQPRDFHEARMKKAGQKTLQKADVTIRAGQQPWQPRALQPPASLAISPARQGLTQPHTQQTHWVEAYGDAGLPIFIRTKKTPSQNNRALTDQEITDKSHDYLQDLKGLMAIQKPEAEFKLKRLHRDSQGHAHLKFAQEIEGIPVYAAEVVVHLYTDGSKIMAGRYQQTPGLNLKPRLTQEEGLAKAMTAIAQHAHWVNLEGELTQILRTEQIHSELVVYRPKGYINRQFLAYHFTLRPNVLERWEYFIDAQTGQVLYHFDHTCSLGPKTTSGQDLNGQNRTINTFQGQDNQYYLLDAARSMYAGPSNVLPDNGDGFILTADLNNTSLRNPSYNEIKNGSNTFSANAISAHHNAGIAYEYFENRHQHQSINASGGDIISFINVVDDNGAAMDNAFWNGSAMFYGNGATAFKPLAGALDVAGHEMSHGVVQATANLEYQGQSGALNESFADIFGAMIDDDDWKMGEDVVKGVFTTGALRDLSNPNNGHPAGSNPFNSPGYQPANMANLYTGNQDNGGVHINSGIPNFAYYKYATAPGMDKIKAEKVYYKALTDYLTRSSQFIDHRLAVIQAATDLYGASSNEVSQAAASFDQVGISNGTGSAPPPTLPPNPGQDFLASTDTDTTTAPSLYISDTQGSGGSFQVLSNTPMLNRVTVKDDGSEGFFVGTDQHIHSVLMNPSNPDEILISSNPEWFNVAISKDGSKLAALLFAVDTAIWVFDLATNPVTVAKFGLYNPTSVDSITTGEVFYANSIEWDYSGEYLLYDAFNRITGTSGNNIEYFDVGFIKVWDNATNAYGSGQITKLFTSLEEGENISNPVFAKNAPNIIAFDYRNEKTGEYSMWTADINQGNLNKILTNNQPSFPNYSKNDDRLIFNMTSNGNPVLGYVDMGPDKITPAQGASVVPFINVAKWGVYYSNGQRALPIDEEILGSEGITVYPNPTTGQLNLDFSIRQPEAITWRVLDMMGKVWLTEKDGTYPVGQVSKTFLLEALPAGLYLIEVEINHGKQVIKVMKQ